MGTWIGHLRIAEKLLEHLPDVDQTSFVVGSLSPDSGIPNEDWSVFDPPKEVTHFLGKGEGEDRINDLVFYRQYMASRVPDDDPACYGFRLGYFFHLIGDSLWARRIGQHSHRLYPNLFAEHGEKAWGILKDDWYGLDLQYVRDHPDSPAWQLFFQAANPPACLPFLSERALHHQLNHIREFYTNPDNRQNLDRPYPYLNHATMSRYVDDTTAALLVIHQALVGVADIAGHNTALALLPENAKTAYDPPLGDI